MCGAASAWMLIKGIEIPALSCTCGLQPKCNNVRGIWRCAGRGLRFRETLRGGGPWSVIGLEPVEFGSEILIGCGVLINLWCPNQSPLDAESARVCCLVYITFELRFRICISDAQMLGFPCRVRVQFPCTSLRSAHYVF